MRGTQRTRRSWTAARLVVLLYLWTFPLLGLIHSDEAHHARSSACNGFASEHRLTGDPNAPVFINLHTHVPSECAVCALVRSVTLAHHAWCVALLAVPLLCDRVTPSPPRAATPVTGLHRSRAPPVV